MEYPIFTLEMEPYVLTNWYHADCRDKSGWNFGKTMTHEDWCKKEVAHWKERGKEVKIVRNEYGQLALVMCKKEE